jgi:hypothetical protein
LTDRLRPRISQWYNHGKSWFIAYNACDVALASEIFGEEYIPRANALNRPISNLDFNFP